MINHESLPADEGEHHRTEAKEAIELFKKAGFNYVRIAPDEPLQFVHEAHINKHNQGASEHILSIEDGGVLNMIIEEMQENDCDDAASYFALVQSNPSPY